VSCAACGVRRAGCTAFELSKKKRVEQDLKNLDAVLACVRTIIATEVRRR
jgi:hypothetical protein